MFHRSVPAALVLFLVSACTDAPTNGSPDSSHDASDVGDTAADTDVALWVRPAPLDLVRYVDPFIGTDGPGNTIPGALIPHGVVRASPVTNSGTGDVDAYEHGDGTFYGIAHMHLEGPGGGYNGYGHIVLRPENGVLDWSPESRAGVRTLDPALERAAPGWYAIDFPDGGGLEVTADQWGAIHRYSFDRDGGASLVLDLSESRGESVGGAITRIGPGEFTGSARYNVHPGVSELIPGRTTGYIEVYWSVALDPPPEEWTTWTGDGDAEAAPASGRDLGLGVSWASAPEVVTARVGLSLIDAETATAHRDALPAEFDTLREQTEQAWNERLNRVRVDSEDEEALTMFYTALYHSMFQPADYTEGDRFVSAWAGEPETFETPPGRRYYTDDWCLWDTYRTSHQLRTLVEPDIVDDIVWSSLHAHETGGWMPKCPWAASGYSRVMTGNPQVVIVADAVVRGFRGFDIETAVEAVRKTSEQDSNPFPASLCGYFGLGTPPEYLTLGYVPHECDSTQSASTTLEIAHADWSVARMGDAIGDANLTRDYDARADNWRHHWDADAGFMRGRMRDGTWVEPFDPADTGDTNDFVEASSWIFSFFVPHDLPALIELHGGPEVFIERLDAFFEGGHFDPSNQPSFHIPFLYAHAGRPDLTQARVDEVVAAHYGTGRDGLPGNDDAGSTSAWLVLSTAGLYPVTPAGTAYTITSPLFDRVEILLDPELQADASFVVEAAGASSGARFIQGATLNGVPLNSPLIEHDAIVSGGLLELEMGPAPSSWGRPD